MSKIWHLRQILSISNRFNSFWPLGTCLPAIDRKWIYMLKKESLISFLLCKAQSLHIWDWELWLYAILLNAWFYNHELDFLYNLLCFEDDLHWLLKILQHSIDDLNICMFEMTILDSCVIFFVSVFLNSLELLFKLDEYFNQVIMFLSFWRKYIC